MGNARTHTTIEFRADARQVADVDRKLKKAFAPAAVRGFNQAVRDTNKALARNQEHTQKIVRDLGRVKEGSKAWRQMSTELKDANRQARQLQETLNRLHRTQGGGRGGGGGGNAGGGGFLGGRGRGGRGYQVQMPSTGALATGMQSVPVFGALAAGSYLAGAQAYGSHLQYQQARMNAAPFLMGSADAMSFSRGAVTPGRFEGGGMSPAAARQAAIERMTPEAGRRLAEGTYGRLAGLVDDHTMVGSLNRAMGGTPFQERVNAQAAKAATARDSRLKAGAGTSADHAAVKIMSGLAHFAETFGSSDNMQRTYAKVLGQRYVPGSGGRGAFDARAFTTEGIQLGLKPQEALQQAASLAQAAGSPVSASEFGSAMGIQRTTGVGLSQQGSAIRALRQSGGMGTGEAVQAMADTVAAAVSIGLEGSEITNELTKQTAFLQRQADMGIKFDATSILATQAALATQTGGAVSGFRAGDIARGFAAGGSEVGHTGPKNAMDLRLMRALGFTGKGGAEEYAAIRLKMQDPGEVMKAMPKLLGQFRGKGFGPNMELLQQQQVLAQYGVRAGASEVAGIARMGEVGDFTGGTDLASLRTSAQELTRATGGSLIAEASIENERIGVGSKVAPSMQSLSRITNDLAGTLQNTVGPVIDVMLGQLEGFTGRLEKASTAMDNVYGVGSSPLLPPKG